MSLILVVLTTQLINVLLDEMDSDSESATNDIDISTSYFLEDDTDEESPPQMESESKPLYTGAPADLTESTATLLLFRYSVKHSLTEQALSDLLNLLSVFLPKDAKFPKSIHRLKKYFLKKHKEKQPLLQPYCKVCHRILKEKELCICGKGISYFITVPLGAQLKARLESKYHSLVMLLD